MIDRLTANLDFHAQALALRSERQRLIASNIANADTPGYQARDFDFPSALRDAAAARAPSFDNRLGGAIAPRGGASGQPVPPQLRWAAASQTNLDRNTVDMDRERASFADNALRYEATLRFVNGQLRTMHDAMKSPSQG